MRRRLGALVLSVFSALAAGACNGDGETPPATQVASIPACAESQETGCENGKPLCAPDEDGACLMCRCTEYLTLRTDSPTLGVANSAIGGNTPTPRPIPGVGR